MGSARIAAVWPLLLILVPNAAPAVTRLAERHLPVRFVDITSSYFDGYRNDPGMGSGAAAADYDNDGDIDIFVPLGSGRADRLYQNIGGGDFLEVGLDARLASLTSSRAALWVDYDGDGNLDLFVANDDPSAPSSFRLYRQEADRRFTEVTVEAGVFKPPAHPHLLYHWGGVSAGDINNDGYLDIFTVQWDGPSHLFLNTGRGGFRDISEECGMPLEEIVNDEIITFWRHNAVMHDFNGDGWIDIYTAVDFGPNELFINQRDNTFVDIAYEAGVANAMNDMGIALGDYDNDGDLDIYVTNIEHDREHNILLRNDSSGGTPRFTEVSHALGVHSGHFGWGATFLDVDNDGDLDLATTNGYLLEEWADDPSLFYLNVDAGRSPFEDVSSAIGFDDTDFGSALLAADFDRDGDLDLFQTCMETRFSFGRLRVLANTPVGAGHGNNYLVVRPRSESPNRFAIGAVVRVTAGDLRMMRLITAGISHMSQEPAEAFFGLGRATVADVVTVEWPDGDRTTLRGVAANQVLDVLQLAPADMVVDVRPGSANNNVNPKAKGVLPVAVMSDARWDAAAIEPATVELAGAPVASRGNGQPMATLVDLDRDGRRDLLVHVRNEMLRLDPSSEVAELRARTRDGRRVRGSDRVRIVPGGAEAGPDPAAGTAEPTLGVSPANPAGRDLRVGFTLPRWGPAALELVDVSGRRLARRDVGSFGPGTHAVRLADGIALAPGVYVVRLTQAGESRVAKTAVVR